MLSAKHILEQLERLTSDLVGHSLCNHQHFPTLQNLRDGSVEVGIGGDVSMGVTLKNVSYKDIYSELDRSQAYNMKMLDGALIQMLYRFRNDRIETHRLAFFPSPCLEEFQNNPEVYLEDVVYAEVVKRNIVPFPVRFDFDSREGIAKELEHPRSHLTLGQYENCRIPVSAPLTPYHFLSFVLRSFYHTAMLS
ncbi:MAG: DUF2290 domain-containing protein, partial [Candidatus Marsarchaeota archaeon]|nr:DUF2290 domain-containing protein [Candidatus Marsarchaeota archaeon]